MPKGSGLTNRDVVNHGQNGKGSASRITDVQAYRENFENIDWGVPRVRRFDKPLKTLRELEEALNR